MAKVNRKLATILATDCVDFSKHMESQEELTLSNLTSCRAIMDPIIEEYGGRIFHTAGDSVIAEFGSPVECVNAAMEFQDLLAARNDAIADGLKLEWRVGIHVDDIIIEGDNIYGSGVNIAARLEGQCEPGRVLLSKIVQDQVKKRVSFAVNPAGTRALKNISDDFEVFYISKKGEEVIEEQVKRHSVDTVSSSVPLINPNMNKKPKLAVLPFTNGSKDEDSGYLVDGIVEDLITEFSMIREFEIVSRQTCFDYRNSDETIEAFSEHHNLDFIVTGGIRSAGNRVRISIELSESGTGKVLWSNKYDRVIEDIFDVQDEIVRTVAMSLLGEIEIMSLQRAKRKATENITSYELLLRGKEMHHRFTAEGNKQALEFFDKAIEADSNNAQAHAWKACTLGQGWFRGWIGGTRDEMFEMSENCIARAVDLNENDFECHRMLSAVHLSKHEFQLAEEHGRKAYDMVPSDPRVLSGYGEVLVRNGSVAEGLALLKKALELDPVPQGQLNSDKRITDLMLANFYSEDFKQCIELGEKIEHASFQSWLFLNYARQQLGLLNMDDVAVQQGIKEFAQDDWPLLLDRLHIPQDEVRQKLADFLSSI
jgi:adenylate cyclase